MTDILYVGLDPSLTATGVAVLDEAGLLVGTARVDPNGCAPQPRAPVSHPARMLAMYADAMAALYRCERGFPADLEVRAAIECPVLRGHGALPRAGLWGLLTHGLAGHLVHVEAGMLKLFACGQVRATKAQVARGILKTWGRKLPSHDEADAYALAQLARAWWSRPEVVPADPAQRLALDRVAQLQDRW